MEQEVQVPDHDVVLPRRRFIGTVALLGAALATEGMSGATRGLFAIRAPRPGEADPPEYPNETVRKIVSDRFGDRPIQQAHVTLDMPALAEDGRVVPVSIESDLPMTPEDYVKGVYLIVDHNPDPLVTAFHLTPAFGALALQTRIKMKRTTWIRAIIETSTGQVYADYKKVETTLNGCG